MTRRLSRSLTCVASAAFAIIGCSEQHERLNAPPQGGTERPAELQKHFIYMADKAMLHDSSVADIHFEPHIAELSGTGVRRLTRMADLLNVHGGTICYETSLRDDALISARLETVRTFLADNGYDGDRILVQSSASRGRGAPAAQSIESLERQSAISAAAAANAAIASGSP